MYRVEYTRKALKQIAALDRPVARRIERFFGQTLDLSNPRSRGRPLVGRDEWRYRIGDYRILAAIEDDRLLVLVVKVAHRRDVYDR